MNITHRWKRIMAVGCSHGEYADLRAVASVLRFKDSFKPHTIVHLGDAFDFACLRSGARDPNNSDRAHPLGVDLECGKNFLWLLEPTHFTFGNHEARVVDLSKHFDARTAHLAQGILKEMREHLEGLHCKTIERWSIFPNSWFKFGDYRFGHGVLYGHDFLRKTAQVVGKSVVAHSHHPGIAKSDRFDGARCISVGCLRTIQSAGFARDRAATLSWGHAFVWGEYCASRAQLWLHEHDTGRKEWRLPT